MRALLVGAARLRPHSSFAGLRFSFPPPHSPVVFITLAAELAHNASLSLCRRPWGCRSSSRSSPALPLSGSCPRSVPRAPQGSPLVGALAALGTSVVANAPFLSAGAVACGSRLHLFPNRISMLMFATCSRGPNARRMHSYWRGLMPPAPPSPTRRIDYLIPSRGRCPR